MRDKIVELTREMAAAIFMALCFASLRATLKALAEQGQAVIEEETEIQKQGRATNHSTLPARAVGTNAGITRGSNATKAKKAQA